MSMTTSVTGYISQKDETYKKHCKVLVACSEAGLKSLPDETAEYFGSTSPEWYLMEAKLEVSIKKYDWEGGDSSGIEIKVSEIPEGVEMIRFENSF